MRIWPALLALAAATPAIAASDPPYYGPMKGWHGIGFTFGFRDTPNADGTWRIDATSRQGNATEMAMYRAAELARDRGYAFVEMLGGSEARSPGMSSATLYARPTHAATTPATCHSKRRACYTADVAQLLRRLGGPDGTQPGVAIPDYVDEHGRSVTYTGFGIARAVPGAPRPVIAPPRFAPLPVAPPRAAVPAPVAADIAARRIAAARPIRGGDPTQGWTITD